MNDAVIVIGITGSGKTSTINQLRGLELTDDNGNSQTSKCSMYSWNGLCLVDSPGFLDTDSGVEFRRKGINALLEFIKVNNLLVRRVVLCTPGRLLDELKNWVSDALISLGFEGPNNFDRLTMCITKVDLFPLEKKKLPLKRRFESKFPGCHVVMIGYMRIGALEDDLKKATCFPPLARKDQFTSSDEILSSINSFQHDLAVLEASLLSGQVDIAQLIRDLGDLKEKLAKTKGCCSSSEKKKTRQELQEQIDGLERRKSEGQTTISSTDGQIESLRQNIKNNQAVIASRKRMLERFSW